MAQEAVTVLDAEIVVVGSILIDSASYGRVSEIVSADSFQVALCRSIFEAAGKLAGQGKTIDPLTIKRQCAVDSVELDNRTLQEYMQLTPTAANDTLYAGIVADHAKRRKLRELAELILEDNTTDTQELISATFAQVEELDPLQRERALYWLSGGYAGLSSPALRPDARQEKRRAVWLSAA